MSLWCWSFNLDHWHLFQLFHDWETLPTNTHTYNVILKGLSYLKLKFGLIFDIVSYLQSKFNLLWYRWNG